MNINNFICFKGPINSFKPSPQRILIVYNAEIPCGASIIILLALKPLSILDRGEQIVILDMMKFFRIINSKS